MLLTKYDRKLHEKTIRQEGWEDGYAASQAKIDELETLVLFKDGEVEKKEEELQLSNQKLSEAEKRIAELETQLKKQDVDK